MSLVNRVIVALWVGLATCPSGAVARPVPPPIASFTKPVAPLVLTGRVVDAANLLTSGERRALTVKLVNFEARTRHQFVLVTTPSLGGMSIEGYGLALGNGWGIGRRGVDDGVLLIVAPQERKVRIEVGKGITTILTDGQAAAIIDNQILPAFRSGRFAEGIARGADAIIAVLSSR